MISEDNTINFTSLAEEFPVGYSYRTIDEFFELFSRSALTKGVCFKIKKRNKLSLTLGCVNPGCGFHVGLSYKSMASVYIIRKLCVDHSCNADNLKKQSGVSSLIIKENRLEDMSAKSIIRQAYEKYNVRVPYSTANKALCSARVKARLVILDSYCYLPSLIERIHANGDFADLMLDSEGRFQRFYMSWNSSKMFFKHSRKILTVDGTFLSGPYKGTLLTAVTQDGFNQLNLIAFSIVESENSSSWSWFLDFLNKTFDINNDQTILCSDRDKGLINATANTIPYSVKANCCRHIAANLRKRFKNPILMCLFWRAVNVLCNDEFVKIMDEIKLINTDFHASLLEIGISTWASSQFKIPKYGMITSNSSESMNSAIKPFIQKDITNLIVSINNYCMDKVYLRSTNKKSGMILSNAQKILTSNMNTGKLMSVRASSSVLYMVENKHIVNISLKTCDCLVYKDTGIPCKHLCAVLYMLQQDPLLYVSTYFSTSNYTKAYSIPISPLSNKSLIKGNIQSPIERRNRGRRRVKRLKVSYVKLNN